MAKLVVEAVQQVSEEIGGKIVIDKDMIKIEKKEGAPMSASELIRGIVIDKEVVHPGMPKRIIDAKICLIDSALELKETNTDAQLQISDPAQLQAFFDKEEEMLKEMVAKVKASGATLMLCQKGIDDLAQHYLSKEGIAAVRRVKKSDMEKLAKATGAKIVTRVQDLTKSDLGYAKSAEGRKISSEEMLFIEGCKNPKSVTLLIRGSTSHIIDEAERAVHDALGTVTTAIKDKKVVSGGGSTEMELAVRLKNYAKTIGGREQLAIEAFAEALEIIPRALAETAGMDPIDTLVELRSKHSTKQGKGLGVNVFKGTVDDMIKNKVIEPYSVKAQAITSAAEVTEMILRIDDIIKGTSKARDTGGGMPPGGMGGGMDGMM